MGNWFENMEAMNIQEERAKTKAAEENLAKAEQKLGEAETKLGEVETKLQESQKSIVQLVKELAGDKTLAVQKLMEDGHMTKEEAEAFVERNWQNILKGRSSEAKTSGLFVGEYSIHHFVQEWLLVLRVGFVHNKGRL